MSVVTELSTKCVLYTEVVKIRPLSFSDCSLLLSESGIYLLIINFRQILCCEFRRGKIYDPTDCFWCLVVAEGLKADLSFQCLLKTRLEIAVAHLLNWF